mgnify:CR=1 FL=1
MAVRVLDLLHRGLRGVDVLRRSFRSGGLHTSSEVVGLVLFARRFALRLDAWYAILLVVHDILSVLLVNYFAGPAASL